MAKSRTVKSNLFRVLDESSQPIYVVDAQRHILFCNQALAEWLGKKIEQITSWQLEFHSHNLDHHRQPACLCPPAEVFAGEPASFLAMKVDAQDQAELRAAMAWPLKVASETAAAIVFVGNPVQPPQGNERENEDDPFSDADWLKMVRAKFSGGETVEPVVGDSAWSHRLRRQIQSIKESRSEVLVTGPVGSGRRQIVESIHYAQSDAGPLIPLDATLSDPEMIQSTVRELFLDEFGEVDRSGALLILDADKLSDSTQFELRELLGLPDLEIKIFTTAQQSLLELARQGTFDFDLAMRLSTFTIELVPLQQRSEDIPLLIQAQIEKFNSAGGRQLSGANKAALQLLTDYHWPGEFTELVAIVHESCERATGPNVVKQDLPKRLFQAETAREVGKREFEEIDLNQFLSDIESELVRRAMVVAKGNKAQAARLLNISRASLIRKTDASGKG